MNALEQIIEELSDDQHSLAGPLLKTKVLASRIGNEEIMAWATRELEGYREEKELPSYRFVKPVFKWIVSENGLVLRPAPVPFTLFDEKFQERLFQGRMVDSVMVIESLTKRKDGNGVVHKEFGEDFCQALTKKIKNNQERRINILHFTSDIDALEAIQVLARIRSKLLDFMLRLEADVPVLDKPLSQIKPIGVAEQSKVTQIFNITVTGDGNTVVAGDKNTASLS